MVIREARRKVTKKGIYKTCTLVDAINKLLHFNKSSIEISYRVMSFCLIVNRNQFGGECV